MTKQKYTIARNISQEEIATIEAIDEATALDDAEFLPDSYTWNRTGETIATYKVMEITA